MGVFRHEAEKSGQREGGVETNAWRVVTTVMQRAVKTARKTMNGERKMDGENSGTVSGEERRQRWAGRSRCH